MGSTDGFLIACSKANKDKCIDMPKRRTVHTLSVFGNEDMQQLVA